MFDAWQYIQYNGRYIILNTTNSDIELAEEYAYAEEFHRNLVAIVRSFLYPKFYEILMNDLYHERDFDIDACVKEFYEQFPDYIGKVEKPNLYVLIYYLFR